MKNPDKKKNQKKPLNKALQLSGAGLQMGLTIYLGFLFGKWLDANFETSFLIAPLGSSKISASEEFNLKRTFAVSADTRSQFCMLALSKSIVSICKSPSSQAKRRIKRLKERMFFMFQI